MIFSTYNLSDEQLDQAAEWLNNQAAAAVKKQKINPPVNVGKVLLESYWENGYPYGGAIGGDYTIMFTPTSLGVQVILKYAFSNETIDLTDYESW